MDNNLSLTLFEWQRLAALEELRTCNDVSDRFGLHLAESQMEALVQRRFEALRHTGRIEFGEGVLRKLVLAFCDSPYIFQQMYEYTLSELQDAFYYFKNESNDLYTDDELIEFMETVFNGPAQGSLDYLIGTSLEDLCRYARSGKAKGGIS